MLSEIFVMSVLGAVKERTFEDSGEDNATAKAIAMTFSHSTDLGVSNNATSVSS